MSSPADDARADLAFLRGIAEGGGTLNKGFGQAYFAAGLIYGIQMLLHAFQFFGWLPSDSAWGLGIGLGPTIIFLPVIIWINWQNRATGPVASTPRAVAAVFGGVGLANFALIAVIGLVALDLHSLVVWLIYPCCVCVLQGAAWFVAFALRRHAWLAVVGAGWIVCAITMATQVQNIGGFILAAGLGMLTCMLVPGLIMMRLAQRGQ